MRYVAIVLSGGGARGMAHLGVLKALEELDIKISAISGVSAGAVIGALYAAGNAPLKILEILKTQSYFGITDLAWSKKGLFTMSGLRDKLSELIPYKELEQLPIPLFVTATDINFGKSITFARGPLVDLVVASASVPVVFEPVFYKDYQLYDGGILNNLPVEPLLGKYDVIIGSHVNKLCDGINPMDLKKSSLIDYCFQLAIEESTKLRSKQCTIFIEPLLSGFGVFDAKPIDEIFKLGYAATMEQKEKLLSLSPSS